MATELGRPSATAFELEDLLREVRRGEVRIPHFQRGFKWGREDVLRLFDSIVKGYPIGSLLLWRHEASAGRVRLGQLEINAPATSRALWVVDGQQRIISLANALSDEGATDPRFALAFDVRERKFVSRAPAERPEVIPLPDLVDLQRLLRRFADYPDLSPHLDAATDIAKAIRQYTIPAYVVEGADVEVLEDIFDRMNNYGKKLSRAEVFTALHAGAEEVAGQTTLHSISQGVEQEFLFGALDDDTVLHALLARRGPDISRDIRTEFDDRRESEFPGEGRDEAFRLGEAAIHRAVAFLQVDAGVPHFAFLPNRFLLVVLVRFFAHFPDPAPRNRVLLRRWFWRAALRGLVGFGGSATATMRQLCSRISPDDDTGSLERLLASAEGPATNRPDLTRFRTNDAATKIVLCSWWDVKPRSPRTGEPYEIADLYQVLAPEESTMRDAVPYLIEARDLGDRRSWAARRILLPTPAGGDGADARFGHRPPELDSDHWDRLLASHSLSSDMLGLLASQGIGAFLVARQARLDVQLRDFIGRVCERALEDTPPLDELDLDDVTDDGPVPGDAA